MLGALAVILQPASLALPVSNRLVQIKVPVVSLLAQIKAAVLLTVLLVLEAVVNQEFSDVIKFKIKNSPF